MTGVRAHWVWRGGKGRGDGRLRKTNGTVHSQAAAGRGSLYEELTVPGVARALFQLDSRS